jgi:MurNAc alpha-1-phosphate uridylyltransferase
LGDFCVDPLGLLLRRPESEVSPYLFTGVQILHPRLFKNAPEGPFSLNVLYDKAIEAGRVYGIVHDGEWFHVGTPESLDEAENYMQKRYSGIKRR